MDVTREPAPTEVATYGIESLLGRGGMGEVYLAEDRRLHRKVALKVLSAEFATNASFRERFLAESELAASIDHPNIVPIYEADEAGGYLYIAMRYVEGTDLKARLRLGPLPVDQAVDLLSQVAGALDLAHERGLVHRDVKPSNVLVAPGAGHDGQDHAYLADFGLTTRLADGGSLADDGQLMGTVDYVAPEQITGGEVDGRADVYSLGCLLVECLTGEPPFQGSSDIAVLFAHLESTPPRPSERRPDLPEGLDHVVRTALAKDPNERYQTCLELVTAARAALGIAEPAHRRSRVAAVVGVAAIALMATTIWLTIGAGDEPRDRLLRIDPSTNEVVDSVDVGDRASSVDIGDGQVWVTSQAGRALWRVDPRTLETRETPVEGTPMDVVERNGLAVVVSGPLEVAVHRIDAATGALLETIPIPGAEGAATAVAEGDEGIWVVGCGLGGGNVGRISETAFSGNSLLDRVEIFSKNPNFVFGHEPDFPAYTDVAVGEGGVWMTLDSGPALRRADPTGQRPVEVMELPFFPRSVTVGAGSIWITGLIDDLIARFDPETREVTMTVQLGRGTAGVAVGAGSVWVVSSIDGTVTRLDPRTGEIQATIEVDGAPEDVVIGAGGVWVTSDPDA
jgi:serine/threonine-protein kinase